jgi:transposase
VAQVLKGQTQAAVARAIGVHPVTIAKWMAAHRANGTAGLAAKPTPGRPRFLSPEQETEVGTWLTQKPTEHGFPTDLWTSRRLVDLIERKFGITFHPASFRRWLKQRGYTPQRPAQKAQQRDEAVIQEWVRKDWPRIQKKRAKRGPTSS